MCVCVCGLASFKVGVDLFWSVGLLLVECNVSVCVLLDGARFCSIYRGLIIIKTVVSHIHTFCDVCFTLHHAVLFSVGLF